MCGIQPISRSCLFSSEPQVTIYITCCALVTHSFEHDSLQEKLSSAPPPPTPRINHHHYAGAIAGGVVGGLAFITLLAFIITVWRRRNRKQQGPGTLHKLSASFGLNIFPNPRHSQFHVDPMLPTDSRSSYDRSNGPQTAPLVSLQMSSHLQSNRDDDHDIAPSRLIIPNPLPIDHQRSPQYSRDRKKRNLLPATSPERPSAGTRSGGSDSASGPSGGSEMSAEDSETTRLRSQLERMQRDMDELRARGMYAEAPPEYS